jgi:hypothetical protein
MTKKKKPIDLKIKTKYDRPDPTFNLHPNYQTWPSYGIMNGIGSCGKTLLTCNICHEHKRYFKKNMYIFSSTINNTLTKLCEDLDISLLHDIYDENGKDIIKELIKYQQQLRKYGEKLEPILIIFEDFIDNNIFNKKRSSILSLFTRGRHSNISVLILSQRYKLIPASIRDLSMYKYFFKPMNNKEKKAIVDENCGWLEPEEFEKIFDDITNTKYNFLFCDHKNYRLLKNFDEVISHM